MDAAVEAIIHEPVEPADSAIIWLHGLGADAHDFEPLMPVLGLSATRFIFPNAPVRPVTINGGMRMRAWYDFLSQDFAESEDLPQIEESVAAINRLVDEQIVQGIPADRIVLAGFSQGGVIALLTALTGNKKLAGVLMLSAYIPKRLLQNSWPQQPRVLQCHGSHDPIIPLAVAKATCHALMASAVPVSFKEYPMAHQLCDDEIEAIKQSLREWL
ncbi:MAG TPA: alpha/beta fold hydrolase [Chromatiales bacterium]|nr:alpha/beta fold hydrolase [Thiotrichales bacterium]HIP68400.1 alpha/beta fold hydrolase [Chromatiales bacterium]